MLLANVAVAEKIEASFPSCSLLRRHPTPAPRQVWYGMVWHGMAWYGMVWHGMAW
jgi:hypothetical protein